MKKSVVGLMVAVALMWTASAATAGETKDSGKTKRKARGPSAETLIKYDADADGKLAKAQSKVIEGKNLFDAYYLPALPRKEWPMVPEKIRKTHNWDNIPRYLAIWKPAKRGKWTEEELSALAQHDMIQLSTPNGHEELAAELKKRNPNIIILGYLNLILDYGSMNGETFKQHPDWYLKHRKTGEYSVHSRRTRTAAIRPLFDIRKPEMCAWWIQNVNAQLEAADFDGLLIDAFAKAVTPFGPRTDAVGKRPEELLEANKSLHLLLTENLKRNGNKGILIGNALRSVYSDCLKSYVDAYLHGSYLEGVEQGNADLYDVHLAHLIDTCIEMQKEGGEKIMCVTMTSYTPPSPLKQNTGDAEVENYDEITSDKKLSHDDVMKLMRENFEYKLAIALIMASNYFYFGYAEGHCADGRPIEMFAPDYPEFKRPLGPPLGPAEKTGPFRYERKFRHASVNLDIAARKGNITWE